MKTDPVAPLPVVAEDAAVADVWFVTFASSTCLLRLGGLGRLFRGALHVRRRLRLASTSTTTAARIHKYHIVKSVAIIPLHLPSQSLTVLVGLAHEVPLPLHPLQVADAPQRVVLHNLTRHLLRALDISLSSSPLFFQIFRPIDIPSRHACFDLAHACFQLLHLLLLIRNHIDEVDADVVLHLSQFDQQPVAKQHRIDRVGRVHRVFTHPIRIGPALVDRFLRQSREFILLGELASEVFLLVFLHDVLLLPGCWIDPIFFM